MLSWQRNLDLAAHLALAYEPALLFLHIRKAACAAADIATMACRIAKDKPVGSNIPCDNRPRTYQRKLSNRDATHNHRPCSDRCIVSHLHLTPDTCAYSNMSSK